MAAARFTGRERVSAKSKEWLRNTCKCTCLPSTWPRVPQSSAKIESVTAQTRGGRLLMQNLHTNAWEDCTVFSVAFGPGTGEIGKGVPNSTQRYSPQQQQGLSGNEACRTLPSTFMYVTSIRRHVASIIWNVMLTLRYADQNSPHQNPIRMGIISRLSRDCPSRLLVTVEVTHPLSRSASLM